MYYLERFDNTRTTIHTHTGYASTAISYPQQLQKSFETDFLNFSVSAEVGKIYNNKWSFYSGVFDFSDEGKKSSVFGIQHLNENMYKDTIFGTLQPISGLMFTADNAGYIYTGVQSNFNAGLINITPSFTPGLYSEGNGKDLGHLVEFKSEIQLSLNLSRKLGIVFLFFLVFF